MQKHVHANQFLLCGVGSGNSLPKLLLRSLGIYRWFQLLGFLSEPGDDRLRKLLGAYFLFADFRFVDVIRVHTILKRPKPSIVNELSYVRLADVDQHKQASV